MNGYRLFVAAAIAAVGPLGFIISVVQTQIQENAQIAAQGTATPFPRPAGHAAYYLAKQLHDHASGERTSARMSPIAKGLSPDDIADVAAYYASINTPFLPLKEPAAALVQRGAQLARPEFGTVGDASNTVGDASKNVTPCENCHGSRGPGDSLQIPYLAGQYGRYIAFELEMWKRGYRKNSPEIMQVIAERLDDQDISALAAYFQQLPAATQASASK